MNCIWILYELHMNCMWLVSELYMDCMWYIYGLYVNCIWIIYSYIMYRQIAHTNNSHTMSMTDSLIEALSDQLNKLLAYSGRGQGSQFAFSHFLTRAWRTDGPTNANMTNKPMDEQILLKTWPTDWGRCFGVGIHVLLKMTVSKARAVHLTHCIGYLLLEPRGLCM